MTTNPAENDPFLRWFKATASQGSSGCVEVAHTDRGTYVRDSKDPEGGRLFFTPHEWECFLDGARNGEFHRP
ncbi:DUF397 domain-containing protein [Marinactinospora thermotolerans]|uniref:DUF397 domain-containing protein n=1 Tax=Marinactinospora thermotolerans DSM 45154 TaxID=1122192 RepID=A0A1T4QCY0_9ACTN|nr:DUF397 domain-containing protein [Marinactinospora thermotolerans]SKA01609.1 protein of unknown function [Marinactinospora thermotolerans DSM 45154]